MKRGGGGSVQGTSRKRRKCAHVLMTQGEPLRDNVFIDDTSSSYSSSETLLNDDDDVILLKRSKVTVVNVVVV